MDSAKQEKQAAGRTVMRPSSSSGSALLIIIIAILVLAVMAAGMYVFTSTSFFNQESAQDTMKAQYLADAGPRIAVSELWVLTGEARNAALLNLNNSEFAAGDGRVRLQIFPYWFIAANNIAQNTNNPVLSMLGRIPRPENAAQALNFPQSGLLKVASRTGAAQYVGAPEILLDPVVQGQTAQVRFNVPAGLPFAINANDVVMVGFAQNENGGDLFQNGQVINQGDPLVLQTVINVATGTSEIGEFFPEKNGNFTLVTVGGVFVYHYDRRTIDGDGITTLTNIQPRPVGAAMLPFATTGWTGNLDGRVEAPPMSMQIYVGGGRDGNTLGVRSTGIVN